MCHDYIDPLIDRITYINQIMIMLTAYILNIMLIFIIGRSARKDIGTYRVLITYFALSDIYYNTLHFIVYPIPEMYGNAFIMRGHGYLTDVLGVALYLGAYGHAFPILIVHFFPKYLQNFRLLFSALVVATAACNALIFTIFYHFFGPDEESLRILAPVFNGSVPLSLIHTVDTAPMHVQPVYWAGATFEGPRWRNLTGVIMMGSTMAVTYVIIVICTVLINDYLKKQLKSAISMRLHKQLFRSLLYQSFVPLVTAYSPAGISVMLPVFGITVPYISIILPLACSTHPLFDPLVLMLTITEYRRSFFSLIGLSKLLPSSNSAPSKEVTITIQLHSRGTPKVEHRQRTIA